MICDTCVYKDICNKKSALDIWCEDHGEDMEAVVAMLAECQETVDEARREAMKLDDNEDSLKWRFNH